MSTQKLKSKNLALKRIGLWATIWWGVSGLYVVLLVWLAKDQYVTLAGQTASSDLLADWWSAIDDTFLNSNTLIILLWLIIIVWLISGYLWLRELKHQKINYKVAFKDLFLTIRR